MVQNKNILQNIIMLEIMNWRAITPRMLLFLSGLCGEQSTKVSHTKHFKLEKAEQSLYCQD